MVSAPTRETYGEGKGKKTKVYHVQVYKIKKDSM